ncbi:MAG: cell wall hydrolase [Erythrobacter sp.]
MSRKTYSWSAVAIVATAGLTFSSADLSGALAQEGELDQPSASAEQQAVETVFVAEEVVQPLPVAPVEEETPILTDSNASSLAELVAAYNGGSELGEQMRCLAGAVYFESRGEPLAGQLAVAQVVINRADDRRFPASYCGVVYQRAQFSFVRNGQMPSIRSGSGAWQRAKAIAQIAHNGTWSSEVEDSLYFHAHYVRPSWSRRKTQRARINTHIFYR